jgi:uncharacterized protein (TIGR03437 family)
VLVLASVPASAAVSIFPNTPVNLSRGQSQQYSVSAAIVSASIATAPVTPNSGTLAYTPGDTLLFYTAPNTISALVTVTLTVNCGPVAGNATATIFLTPTSAVSISVSPGSASLNPGQQQQFTANVTGSSNMAVTWKTSVGDPGGIDSTGLYTAPASITVRQTVTVTATSLADPTKSATATITLLGPSLSISPTTASLSVSQSTTFTVSLPIRSYTFNPTLGTVQQTSENNLVYTAPSSLFQTWTIILTAFTDGGNVSATITLNPSVAVSISPSTASLGPGQTQQFTATVTGNNSQVAQGVTWRTTGDPLVVGTIVSTGCDTTTSLCTGLYTAPATITARTTVTVTAVSVADPTKSASATVTLLGPSVSILPPTASLNINQSQTFTVSLPITSYTITPGGLGTVVQTSANNLIYTAPSDLFTSWTLTLTVVTAGGNVSATITLNPSVAVSVSPTAVSLGPGQQQPFIATVTGTSSQTAQGVTWRIATAGDASVVGSIDQTGFYTAPLSIAARITVTVTAVSAADPTKSASATVTLNPASVTITPATVSLNAGQQQLFTAAVANTAVQTVAWSLTPQIGAIDPVTGLYTAPDSIATRTTVILTATSVADPSKSGSATITLQAVNVSVNPSQVTLSATGTYLFGAVVTGASNTAVTWSISPSLGSITTAGFYTAPDTITSRTTVTVTATSVADPTRSGTATITLNATTMTIAPSSVTLNNGQTQQFIINVAVGEPPVVNWSINPPSPQGGTITADGLYTAPAVVQTSQRVTLTATAASDSTRTATAAINLVPFTDVGHGSPTPAIQTWFINAYFRAGFNAMTSLPPIADVHRYGTTGLIQEFNDANKTSGVKLALIKPNTSSDLPANNSYPVFQVWSDVYAYYQTVGSGTAGYPNMDTALCAPFDSANSCTYQFFDKNYALFVYKAPMNGAVNYSITTTYYNKWSPLGGINGLGRPIDIVVAVTASTGNTANQQTYSNGIIYSITSGSYNGKMFAVMGPLYTRYLAQGGQAGPLGLPIADELLLTTGVRRQTFQGGAIEYTPGGDTADLKLAVKAVGLTGMPNQGTLRMNYGDTLTLTATAISQYGATLAGRAYTWSTTNGQVIGIQPAGSVAVLKAIGGGMANVTVSCEGVTSAVIPILVTAPCCKVGEGAPTAAVQQNFQDAVARNALQIAYPSPNPVTRVGNGYVQVVQSQDGAAFYMLSKSDKGGSTYVVAGNLLARYQALGGPAGTLGYPSSDATAGGRQMFENGYALAGSPVRVAGGAVLSKWALLGYETGAAGSPSADPTPPVLTFGANSVTGQAFTGGAMYTSLNGPLAGQTYFSSGPILARYLALGGPAGSFGMPTGDEVVTGIKHVQNFEGGTIDYSVGDAAAQEHSAARQPTLVAVPATVTAGGRLRLAAYGFADKSTLRISTPGQPDFQVAAASGAYTWEVSVPLSAASGTVQVQAADAGSTARATGSYTIRGLANNRVPIAKVQGDSQTGLPGAMLPLALRVALKDASGAGVAGVPVTFTASPGGQVTVANTVTDGQGYAETQLRLPPSEGVALVSVDAPGVASAPATFGARSVAATLTGFPRIVQAGAGTLGASAFTFAQKGALLAATAAILRYHQNRGELPAPNGLADLVPLNAFLNGWCTADAKGNRLCDGFLSSGPAGEPVVNLWRAAQFTGGVDPVVLDPSPAAVADALAQGSPVLLSLALTANSQPAGGHFVVATGIASDGSVVIQDTNADFGRSALNDYLNAFPLGVYQWKAQWKGAVRLAMQPPGARRFLLGSISQPQAVALDAGSVDGPCGAGLELGDAVVASAPVAGGVSRFLACDGSDALYQLSVGAGQPYQAAVTDLAPGGGGVVDLSGTAPAQYQATRPVLALAVTKLAASFDAAAVVNAATFTPGIAPGGLMAIFGAGLGGGSQPTTVTVDGQAAKVVSASPYQVNAQVPPATAPGTRVIQVQSPFGAARQSVEVKAVAPAIFLLGASAQGAVVNQDGRVNMASNPLGRGQTIVVYCTGLGAVTVRSGLSWTAATVTAVVNGVELATSFAGLAPGYTGLYQVNIPVPVSLPPGLDLPLALKIAGATSNAVNVSIQ